ncbi:MAG: hypothetical protein COV52_07895 [Gammaproteobacteria bacterium CG11_big_fil_rev_8_21_14_0_20_46_22]|nr:MAG: hypothetical protein COW05_03975 [Gammaproteobacteria bacterium CG12_big_fil_rev_8_21_14_0_65_46_12]PIR10678.1 MAG: hypothetical protein COV52_07895 [Gammaproteobacteria bacterium CG11_big_fil_rev_8_21_14_0_20_46_22]
MKRVVIYAVILVLAIIAGLYLSRDPGYVMFAYGDWSMETSIWFFIIAIAIIIILLWMIARFVFGVLGTPGSIRRWHKDHRSKKAHSLTSDGVLALHEGDWSAAENLLIKGVKSSAIPVVNYLSAARAAQEQLAYDRRDRYLNEALKVDKNEAVAVGLMRAQLQLEHHQLDELKLTLRDLKKSAAKHKQVQKLIYRYHAACKNWRRQLDLIPDLSKQHLIDQDELDQQAYYAVKHVINDANASLEDIDTVWKDLPKIIKLRKPIVQAYIARLIDFGQHDRAAKLISQELKSEWDDALLRLFARVRLEDPDRQLDMVDGWSKKQTASPALYCTIAVVAFHAKAWAITKTYAEKSLRLEKTPEAYLVLALSAERLGEEALMQSALRQGLMLASGGDLGL